MKNKMKCLGLLTALIFTVPLTVLFAQDETPSKEDKLSYYEQRAKEDAQYEQSLAMESDDEVDFWQEQEQYEKDLKKRDRKAYKAYMKGKRDAYAEHARYCDSHCHHSDHYHHHASFYYSYHRYDYPRRRSSIRTGVRIGTPSVRVSIF